MFTVSFYSKVRNTFFLGHEMTSFESVSQHVSTERIGISKTLIFPYKHVGIISNWSIFIELFWIAGEYCNSACRSVSHCGVQFVVDYRYNRM
jgi:hypothetical protein